MVAASSCVSGSGATNSGLCLYVSISIGVVTLAAFFLHCRFARSGDGGRDDHQGDHVGILSDVGAESSRPSSQYRNNVPRTIDSNPEQSAVLGDDQNVCHRGEHSRDDVNAATIHKDKHTPVQAVVESATRRSHACSSVPKIVHGGDRDHDNDTTQRHSYRDADIRSRSSRDMAYYSKVQIGLNGKLAVTSRQIENAVRHGARKTAAVRDRIQLQKGSLQSLGAHKLPRPASCYVDPPARQSRSATGDSSALAPGVDTKSCHFDRSLNSVSLRRQGNLASGVPEAIVADGTQRDSIGRRS